MNLPEKLSDLLKLAIEDLKKCEKDPYYEINMLCWYSKHLDRNTCHICLAGAVLAQELDPKKELTSLKDFPDIEVVNKISLLESIRTGHVSHAVEYYYGHIPKDIPIHIYVESYHVNKEQFYIDMNKVYDILVKYGY